MKSESTTKRSRRAASKCLTSISNIVLSLTVRASVVESMMSEKELPKLFAGLLVPRQPTVADSSVDFSSSRQTIEYRCQFERLATCVLPKGLPYLAYDPIR